MDDRLIFSRRTIFVTSQSKTIVVENHPSSAAETKSTLSSGMWMVRRSPADCMWMNSQICCTIFPTHTLWYMTPRSSNDARLASCLDGQCSACFGFAGEGMAWRWSNFSIVFQTSLRSSNGRSSFILPPGCWSPYCYMPDSSRLPSSDMLQTTTSVYCKDSSSLCDRMAN